jgi:hypothetical protein
MATDESLGGRQGRAEEHEHGFIPTANLHAPAASL